MSSSVRSLSFSSVVSRLRTAGCVYAEDEAKLLISGASTTAELAAMVERRATGLPLEHVLGWAVFCGLRILVHPNVFVPRRRTELLVTQASAALPRPNGIVIDLCCGSGAVSMAVLAAHADAEVHAVDIDPDAVECARDNLLTAGAHVYQGDLYDPLPPTLRGRVDVLLANAPYVPTAEIGLLPTEARLHEPPITLDGGSDGLDVLRRIASAANSWLVPGGQLLVETSERQASLAADTFANFGLAPRVVRDPRLDATVVIGGGGVCSR